MGFFDFFKKKEAPAIEYPTTNESASWSLISVVSDEGNCVRFYIDLSSIENVDGNRRTFALTDLERADPLGFHSILEYVEYDAKLARRRVLRAQFYERNMAEGACLSTVGVHDWIDIEPGGGTEAELKAVFQ